MHAGDNSPDTYKAGAIAAAVVGLEALRYTVCPLGMAVQPRCGAMAIRHGRPAVQSLCGFDAKRSLRAKSLILAFVSYPWTQYDD